MLVAPWKRQMSKTSLTIRPTKKLIRPLGLFQLCGERISYRRVLGSRTPRQNATNLSQLVDGVFPSKATKTMT